ncbi:MAG: hypothetical protein HQL50_12530 [Magnetococcales bacterium]|nr:hypothetical protein [Magnetococcales bacterium]
MREQDATSTQIQPPEQGGEEPCEQEKSPPPSTRKPGRWRRWLLAVVVSLSVVMALPLVAILNETVRPLLLDRISRHSDLTLSTGAVYLEPSRGRLVVESLHLHRDSLLADVDRLTLDFNALLSFGITRLRLDLLRPRLRLTVTHSEPPPSAQPLPLPELIRDHLGRHGLRVPPWIPELVLSLRNGRMEWRDQERGRQQRLETLHFHASSQRIGEEMTLTGRLQAVGDPGGPLHAMVRITEGALLASGMLDALSPAPMLAGAGITTLQEGTVSAVASLNWPFSSPLPEIHLNGTLRDGTLESGWRLPRARLSLTSETASSEASTAPSPPQTDSLPQAPPGETLLTRGFHLTLTGRATPPGSTQSRDLSLKSVLKQHHNGWRLEKLSGALGTLLTLTGEGGIPSAGGPDTTDTPHGSVALVIKKPVTLLKWLQIPQRPTMTVKNPWTLTLHAGTSISDLSPPHTDVSPAEADVVPVALKLHAPLHHLAHGAERVSGMDLALKSRFTWPLPPEISAAFTVKAATITTSNGTRLRRVRTSGTVHGVVEDGGWRLNPFTLHADAFMPTGVETKKRRSGRWQAITARGALHGAADGSIHGDFRVNPGSGPMTLTLRQTAAADAPSTTGKALPLDTRLNLHLPKKGLILGDLMPYLPQGWSTAGQLKGELSAHLPHRGPVALRYSLNGRDLAITTPPSSEGGTDAFMLEKGALSLKGSLAQQSNGLLSLKSDISLKKGEWLHGAFYGNLAEEQASVHLTFRQTGSDAWSLSTRLNATTSGPLSLTLKRQRNGTIGKKSKKGRKPRYQLSASMALKGFDLGRLHALYLADALAVTSPNIAGVTLTGTLSGQVKIRLPEPRDDTPTPFPSLGGHLILNNGSLAATSGAWRVGSLEIDLPLHASRSSSGKAPNPGLIQLDDLTFGTIAVAPITLKPLLVADSLRLMEPVEIALLGGRVTLVDLLVTEIASQKQDLQGAVTVEEIDIGQLTTALGTPTVEGTLQGGWQEIRWKEDALLLQGSVMATVFNGLITLKGVSLSELLSPLPTLRASLDMERLDLGRLTRFLEMGEIHGTVSGAVNNLVMAGTEPVSFKAHLVTVDGKPSHRISVKALESLQVMGSGGGASGSLQRGILSIFKEYRYDKLGFHCSLVNDTFHLRGVERSGNRDYLVVGAIIPPTVDVVSHNPRIGWNDMVDRMTRVTKSDGDIQVSLSGDKPKEEDGAAADTGEDGLAF